MCGCAPAPCAACTGGKEEKYEEEKYEEEMIETRGQYSYKLDNE
jgi:hypothetical protein